ncbi:MAG: acyl-CoA thioesterase [Elusimicrobia bacterium]|nr:acyl-CoA thioesterase [Elusimicrobiota bacterium]
MDRKDFNFSTELRVRLPETDAFGIVFHANFFIYFDVARVDYLRNLDALRFISPAYARNNALVHADADFRSPARFDDVLVVHARIPEFKTSSFTFEFLTLHKAENRVVATGKTTLVVVDEKTWRPVPVPEEFRALVRKFEGPSLIDRKSP